MSQNPTLRRPKAVGVPRPPKKEAYPPPPAGALVNGLSEPARKVFELAMRRKTGGESSAG